MADKSPAFQFYARDYLADENVMFMELEEEGAYVRLMAFCWLEGSIPSDLQLLARLCKIDPERMARLWPALEPCFEEHPGDPSRLVHPRLEREREKQADHRERMSEAGKKGAERRWKKRRKSMKPQQDDSLAIARPSFENGHPNAIAMASDSSAVCSLQSATAVEDITSCLPPDTGGQEFSTYWKVDREIILAIWHLGSETVTIKGEEIGMGLEATIHRELCLAHGGETVSGALPFIRQAEDIPADQPISLRLPESRPEVLNRCIGLWHKSTLTEGAA